MLRIAAITIAVIAVFMGVMYLRFSGDYTHTVPVVAAAHDIAAGTQVKESMVEVIDVPDEQVVAGAYSDTAPVVGQVTRVALAEGEQVTSSRLGDVVGSVVKFCCPPGKRAVSLEIEPVTTDGELVFRGDRVDILIDVTGDVPQTAVENVQVLAVDSSGALPLTAERQRQGAVTVALEPQQVQQVLLLQEAVTNGGTMSLRKVGTQVVEFGPTLEE